MSVRRLSLQDSLEAIIGLVHVELQVSCLFWGQLLGSSHLIERDEPLDNFTLVFKVSICDLVDCLDCLDQDGVKSVFGEHIHLDGIEEGDEVLGSCDDVCGSGAGSLCLSGRAGWC